MGTLRWPTHFSLDVVVLLGTYILEAGVGDSGHCREGQSIVHSGYGIDFLGVIRSSTLLTSTEQGSVIFTAEQVSLAKKPAQIPTFRSLAL